MLRPTRGNIGPENMPQMSHELRKRDETNVSVDEQEEVMYYSVNHAPNALPKVTRCLTVVSLLVISHTITVVSGNEAPERSTECHFTGVCPGRSLFAQQQNQASRFHLHPVACKNFVDSSFSLIVPRPMHEERQKVTLMNYVLR